VPLIVSPAAGGVTSGGAGDDLLHDADAAVLLDDELEIAIGGILHHRERRREPAGMRA